MKTNCVPACLFCSLLPSGHHYWSLLVLTAVFGFIISSGPTVSTPLLVDLLDIQHLNTAFGKIITLSYMLLITSSRNSDICPWTGCSSWPFCCWVHPGYICCWFLFTFLHCFSSVWCLCLSSLFDLVRQSKSFDPQIWLHRFVNMLK